MKYSDKNPKTFSEKILEALAEDKGIQSIIDLGGKILGNPISLVDASRKHIAVTDSPEVEDDPIWKEVITYGYTSQITIAHNASIGLTDKLSRASAPFFWESDRYIKYRRIMARVTYKEKTIGILTVYQTRKPFTEEDLAQTKILCDAVSSEMQKNPFFHSILGNSYELFIKELLEGKIKDSEIVRSRTEFFNLGFKKKIFVLAVDAYDLDKTNILPSYLRSYLEKNLIDSKTILFEEHVVLLISCDSEKRFWELGLEDIKAYLYNMELKAGLSRAFEDLSDVQEYHIQALEALKLGKLLHGEAELYTYDDYALYHFIDIRAALADIKKLLHPAIFTLVEYDRTNNTSYLYTLNAYFLSSRNIPATAKKLHLHRNSMFYRLEKIQELTSVDLNDSNSLLHIELSFKLMELYKPEDIEISPPL